MFSDEGDRAPLYPPPASKRDTGEGTGHKGKETETPSVRTSQKKRRSIDGIPNHGHQGVDGVGRFKALAARSASATGVKVCWRVVRHCGHFCYPDSATKSGLVWLSMAVRIYWYSAASL